MTFTIFLLSQKDTLQSPNCQFQIQTTLYLFLFSNNYVRPRHIISGVIRIVDIAVLQDIFAKGLKYHSP